MESRKPYTKKEKNLLAELVKIHVDVVENKQTNGVSLGDKQNAWKQIRDAFNAQPEIETRRDEKQLKKLWDNLKQQKRRQNTAIQQELLRTGGGPPSNNDGDELMDILEATVLNLEVQRNCLWDSVSTYTKNEHEDKESQREDNAGDRLVQENERPPTERISRKRENVRFPKKAVDQEKALRLKKLEESIEQQRELHEIKKAIAYNAIKLEAAKVDLEYKKKLLENINKFK